MKRLTLIVITALLATPAAAQDTAHVYQSVFGDSSTVWYIVSGDDDGGSTMAWETYGNDSIIVDEMTYRMVHHTDGLCCGDGWEVDEVAYPQYIRESPDHARLYLKTYVMDYPDTGIRRLADILLMDLNLGVGDTFSTEAWSDLFFGWNFGYSNFPVPVITVDTIFYAGGRKVVRTDYVRGQNHSGYDTLSFIEGIGPSMGLLYPRKIYPHILMCCYKDDTLAYQRNPSRSCGGSWTSDYWPVGINTGNEDGFRMYPNPTDGIVHFDIPQGQGATLRVTTTLGNTVFCQPIAEGRADLSALPRGVYLITVATGGNIFTSKLVKK